MVDKVLRKPKEQILTPLAHGPLRALHPTAVTLLACVVGLMAAVAAWQQLYGAALVLWLLNRTLDGLDGTLARVHGRQSDLGGYLDILLDVLVYAAVPAGLALGVGTPAAYLSLALLLGSFYINGASWMYLAALLEKRSQGARASGELTTVTMPGGLIEGAETVLFYALFLLFPTALVPLFGLMALLVGVTTVQRLVWAVRTIRNT
ncbi:MAG TPA: CDP-alcohol phosphatidyltransferase family protein [Roseiflexaceae bacterium]|nr:CDP-alcohol phosphatidyltransferase family protein [Roseiflexaceae bacterium]